MKATSKLAMTIVVTMVLIASNGIVGFARELSDKEYDQYLIKALQDENIGIRASAAQLLGERKAEEAVKPLAKMLKTEKHYAVRIVVAMALHQIGDEKVLPILKERYRKDRNKTVKHVLAGLVENLETTRYANK